MNIDQRLPAALRSIQSKNFDEALWHIDKLLHARPDETSALSHRCLVLGWLGRFVEQDATLIRLQEQVSPTDPDLQMTLARCAVQAKRWPQAKQHFQNVLQAQPENKFARETLLRICVNQQDLTTIAQLMPHTDGSLVSLHGYRAIQLGPFVQFVEMANCTNTILRSLLNDDYESEERNLCSKLLEPGDRVLDIGCGIGAVTTHIAARVGAHNVLSLDANPHLLPVAQATTLVNGLQVRFMHAILSSDRDVVSGATRTFPINQEFWASALDGETEASDTVDVPVHSLEELIVEHGATAICIDIEGAEVDLLSKTDLPGIVRMIMEIHPETVGNAACNTLLAHLISIGFSIDFSLSQMERNVCCLRRVYS